MGILDEIIQEDLQQSQTAQSGIADEIISEEVQRNLQATGQQSKWGMAVTLPFQEPVYKYTGKGGTGASFWTHVKQGFVDDPYMKVNIYSKDRFPHLSQSERLSRYKIQDGEIIFKDDDGKWYSENPDFWPFKLKKFLGETTAHFPSLALGTLGATAGPGTAGLGAAAGEIVRKNIGTYGFGETPDITKTLVSAGKEGALGTVGEVGGRVVIKGLRKAGAISGGKKGLKVVKAAGPDLPNIDFKKASRLQKDIKEKFGVDLFDAQTTESRRLLNKLNLYGDLPDTSDIVQVAKKMQDEQAFKAVDNYFNALYDVEPEYVTRRAIKMRDGRVVSSEANPYNPQFEIDPENVSDILDDQGYITNRGRYLTQREAYDLVGDPEEIIAGPAIKTQDGKIYRGEPGGSHHELLDKIPMYGKDGKFVELAEDDGFVTTTGRYISRDEAVRITGEESMDATDILGHNLGKPEHVIDRIIPGTETMYAGARVTEAAQKAIDREIKARVAKAKPFYKKAFAKKTEIDIQPHIDEINEMISKTPETSRRRKKLQEFKRMLQRTVVDKNGKKKLVPESRIEQLDEIKKEIDSFLEPRGTETPIDSRTKKDVRTIKNSILEDLDDANDDYKMARQLWADDSEAVKRLTHKTQLQGIANLEGDQVDNAAKMLFNNLRNNPRIVRRARARIMREDPEAWDAGLRVYVEDLFNKTQQSAEGGAQNTAKLFNSFYRKTIGDKKQRDILAAAMGGEHTQQFKTFDMFVDMLRRTALVVKKESMTAARQEMLKEDLAGSGFVARQIAARFKPLVTHRRLVWEKLMDMQTSRGRKLSAEAMTDPRASQRLLKLRKMNLATEKGIRAASTFLSLVLGGEFSRHGTQLYESYQEYKER